MTSGGSPYDHSMMAMSDFALSMVQSIVTVSVGVSLQIKTVIIQLTLTCTHKTAALCLGYVDIQLCSENPV